MRVIKQGLAGEDRVVVSGIQRAIPGSAVKPVAAPTTSSAAANPAGRQEKP
jgi:hypothetical protein